MLSGQYNFLETEKEILNYWSKEPIFKPEYNPRQIENRVTYTNILPPPNANGELHIGHALGMTYQDLMGRYQRLLGKEVLLLPGKDHAGIQTEVVFEKILEKEGLKKNEIGREEFYKRCFDFCIEMAKNGTKTEKSLGLSADFDRELFTLDPKIVHTVLDTFKRLYTDGFVYKGAKIVNWCVRCQTTVADIDTEYKEKSGNLYYIKVPLKEGNYLTIATTRPETMLGDNALVVNPKDERYSHLIGQTAVLPITNREIPIIDSTRIEIEFGTGVLKLTTAHSKDDEIIAKEWEYSHQLNDKNSWIYSSLKPINVIWKDGKMVGPIPEKYIGLKVNAARELIIDELTQLGLVDKIEEITHNVTVCERCKSVIEPLISSQWFIKVNDLKKIKNDISIYPESKQEVYLNWVKNLRDWPISRQLWWGYRMPVWYKGEKIETVNSNGEVKELIGGIEVNDSNQDELIKVDLVSPGVGWVQDPDVFDTWFSSGQWPFATLMAHEGDFEKYYPTQMMETGYDILNFWVSRMVMLGQYRTGKSPFNQVYLHGLVTDAKGQKMSKSKGNGISPIDMQMKYGTDALRWALIVGIGQGQHVAISEEKIKAGRNFINKIWNASKFVLSQAKTETVKSFDEIKDITYDETTMNLITSMSEMKKTYQKTMNDLRFGQISEELYAFFWNDFCDKYLEFVKDKLGKFENGSYIENTSTEAENLRVVLNVILKEFLKMLHPFIPFATERIWMEFNKYSNENKYLMYSEI